MSWIVMSQHVTCHDITFSNINYAYNLQISSFCYTGVNIHNKLFLCHDMKQASYVISDHRIICCNMSYVMTIAASIIAKK